MNGGLLRGMGGPALLEYRPEDSFLLYQGAQMFP